jgi:hypothetical protein
MVKMKDAIPPGTEPAKKRLRREDHKITGHCFAEMARHLANLRPALKPGARLVSVGGDPASSLCVTIRTGPPLGKVAERLGYRVERSDLFRTRLATKPREQVRGEMLDLHWAG